MPPPARPDSSHSSSSPVSSFLADFFKGLLTFGGLAFLAIGLAFFAFGRGLAHSKLSLFSSVGSIAVVEVPRDLYAIVDHVESMFMEGAVGSA